MKNTLQALLPIHALRERRALRQLHEQQQAHAQALQAEAEARGERERLAAESAATKAGMATASEASASELQWQLQLACSLQAQADLQAQALPQLGEQVQQLQAAADEARVAHLARVRGHRKIEVASRQWARRAGRVLAARAEQQADDDFAVRWAAAKDIA